MLDELLLLGTVTEVPGLEVTDDELTDGAVGSDVLTLLLTEGIADRAEDELGLNGLFGPVGLIVPYNAL